MSEAQKEVSNAPEEDNDDVPAEDRTSSENSIEKENREEKELEPFEYTKLNFETKEMRFLTLEPGIPDTPVHCTMSTQPLSECEPYTYVINTRGNPIAWIGIGIDGKGKHVTRNIGVFLEHIRSKDTPQRLWFRDVCLNHLEPEEKARYWNPKWMDTMIKHASKVIDLSEVTAELWDTGELPRPFPPEEKQWNREREPKPTKHHPAPLHMQKGFIDPPPPHEYLPLDYVADEFRLIFLMPTENYDDPLSAKLAYSVMHDDVTYCSLSYTWGPPEEEPTSFMLLNGQKFLIRKNLELALRELRPQRCNLWIDAICIDQTSNSERNRQIPRMLEIYDDADSVFSWLGPADEASDTAIDLLSELRSPKLNPDEEGNWGPYTIKENDEWKIKPIPDLPRRLAALYRLFLRPYFRRIWVIQELAAANHPTVYCGKKITAWRDLDMAAYHLVDILHRDTSMPARMMAADPELTSVDDKDISFVRRLFYIRHLRSQNADHWGGHMKWTKHKDDSPGIVDVMILGRDFDSTSAHDKIFALLNLAQDMKDIDFKPDYSKSLSQTYREFAMSVANTTKSLDIIATSEPFTSVGLEIPSWVPDWSTPSSMSSLVRREHIPNLFMSAIDDISGPIYSACGPPSRSPRFSFTDEGVLDVAGLVFDTVKSVHHKNGDNFIAEWMSIAANATLPPEAIGTPGQDMPFMEKFWSMLAGDVTGVWSIETIPASELPFPITENKNSDLPFRPICLQEDKRKHITQRTLADNVRSIITRGRSMIITGNGFMGLAPHYCEKGQKVAVLSTCTVPVLLKEEDDGRYRLLGSVFVQGWMEGEGLVEMGIDCEEAWEVLDEGGRLRIV